jgi:uncharacterized membrane protein SirB2
VIDKTVLIVDAILCLVSIAIIILKAFEIFTGSWLIALAPLMAYLIFVTVALRYYMTKGFAFRKLRK